MAWMKPYHREIRCDRGWDQNIYLFRLIWKTRHGHKHKESERHRVARHWKWAILVGSWIGTWKDMETGWKACFLLDTFLTDNLYVYHIIIIYYIRISGIWGAIWFTCPIFWWGCILAAPHFQEIHYRGALTGNSSSPTHVMFTADAQFLAAR